MNPNLLINLSKISIYALFFGLTACGSGGSGNDGTGAGGGVNNFPAPLIGSVYYVNSSMPDDSGNGQTPATARKYIHSAVAGASSPATILVAGGDYPVSHEDSTHVVLIEGISLYGGHNANFTLRDPATYISRIKDTSTTSTGSFANPHIVIEGNGAITSATVIDGFTILGSIQGTDYTAAIWLINGASPTIQNNLAHGGRGSFESCGIYNNASSPTVQNNTIDGGDGHFSSYGIYSEMSSPTLQNNFINGGSVSDISYAIYNDMSSPAVQNNIIIGGSGSNSSYGIVNTNSSSPTMHNNNIYGGAGDHSYGIQVGNTSAPTIRNNTIHGGSGMTMSYGLQIADSAIPVVENNIFLTRIGSGSLCVDEAGATADPQRLGNNAFYNCQILYYDADGGCTGNGDSDNLSETCTLAELNALGDITGGVSGNISDDPLFVDIDGADDDINTMNDNDWHFRPNSPLSITKGGLNGIDQGWTFTTDKDGVVRPDSGPWAIGSYEP